MCGRLSTAFLSPGELKKHFSVEVVPPFDRRYNIAPSLQIPVLREQNGHRTFALLRWGLLPPWTKDRAAAPLLFNARAETLPQKPTFRGPFRDRRCIIAASGFYEWQQQGEKKQSYYLARRDHQPLALAGLWDAWENRETGEVIESCTIVTVAASAEMRAIHDRMPAILETEDYGGWLDAGIRDAEVLQALLMPREGVLELVAVDGYVNNARNEGERCIEPVETLPT
jgi:putative SOS response-associated peptidase YedK